jgi:2-keto-4-pentenoate hydratase
MTDALPASLEPLAAALVDARRRRATIDVSGLRVPQADADAYAVQRAVAHACGWKASRPIAWKVGAPDRAATPNAAPLPASGVHASPGVFAPGTFNRILIEGEIAFRLRAPLRSDTPDDAAAAAAVGDLVVTIEIVDPRYRDMDAAGPLLRVADHGMHGALVVGSSIRWSGSIDWGSIVAIVRRNGEVVRETRGGHPLGDLLFLLRWLATHAEQRGMALDAGDLVTAGTWTGVFEAASGQRIDVEFPGIGRASARFG